MPQQNALEESLLLHCPFCRYCLTGLPEVHVCPECGRAVDRRWELFGTESYWARLSPGWRWTIGLGLATWAFCAGLCAIRGRIAVLWPLFFAIPWPFGLWRRSPVFVAVGPAGVVVLHRKKGPLGTYDWDRISEADLDCRHRPILTVDDKDVTIAHWKAGYDAARACVRCINDHLDQNPPSR